MNASILGQIALTFGILSLISVGGANATIPEIHRQIVDVLHWMDDATFANLVAIGQSAPGPNVLIVSMIGWQVAGIAGLLTATLAVLGPSSIMALGVGRVVSRFATVAWIGVARSALAPIAVGFMLASSYVMIKAAYQGSLSFVIAVGVALIILVTRQSPLLGIAAGAAIGVLGHRFHVFV